MGTHHTSTPGTDATTAGPQLVASDDAGLSRSEISDLLSNQRRRYVLYYLLGCTDAASVEEITEQVAVWETETRASDVPADVYQQVRVAMHHVHLPKLVDMGAVEHDEASDLVTLADGNERLTIELSLAAEREHRRR